jgi:hypothetical protein
MKKMSTAWLSLSFAILVSAPQSYARDTVANQIHSHRNGIAIWWTGNA